MTASNNNDLAKPDPDDIRNWVRLDARITTSGRLQEADPARLAAIGVRHVVNLALDEHPEALPDAATRMVQAGLRYTHIPIPFDRPTQAHYDAFVAAIEDSDEPVHVHCIMNQRVSAFFYRYNRDGQSMAEPEARALMERVWNPLILDNPVGHVWSAIIAPNSSGDIK